MEGCVEGGRAITTPTPTPSSSKLSNRWTGAAGGAAAMAELESCIFMIICYLLHQSKCCMTLIKLWLTIGGRSKVRLLSTTYLYGRVQAFPCLGLARGAGTLLIEPKPQEPTKHQYDWDPATSANFLRKYDLLDEFKLNIECNHATLSGHSCHHELETARINGLLGNIDANTGDPQIGWDTDQFLTDIGEGTMVMISVIRNGGLAPGGFNFDAKLRRESTDVEDLFIAHISGMDTLARGLRNAAKLIEDGSLGELVKKRYQSFDSEIGQQIEAGKADFDFLEKKAMEWGEPKVPSAKQELAEMFFQSSL
ncbi:xylose isomerase [Tripterygium wilfordii]|uniref:xylose isomerase n=1 Tax=Tripterygium wilfordii TaxID=458696 RepID=UPI0018F86218|nr:xylose isomerase [Tripterygium wilfordii]